MRTEEGTGRSVSLPMSWLHANAPDHSHVLDSEERRVERNAYLVEHVARQSSLAVCGCAFVDLSLLCRIVLQLKLVAENIEAPPCVLTHLMYLHQEEVKGYSLEMNGEPLSPHGHSLEDGASLQNTLKIIEDQTERTTKTW
jgi:hypothetical protein